jgi:hypothetical protein
MAYTPRMRYTARALLEAEIADHETDLRCAERDGLGDYAKEVKQALDAKRAALALMPNE